jgi:hypothetical protein
MCNVQQYAEAPDSRLLPLLSLCGFNIRICALSWGFAVLWMC